MYVRQVEAHLSLSPHTAYATAVVSSFHLLCLLHQRQISPAIMDRFKNKLLGKRAVVLRGRTTEGTAGQLTADGSSASK